MAGVSPAAVQSDALTTRIRSRPGLPADVSAPGGNPPSGTLSGPRSAADDDRDIRPPLFVTGASCSRHDPSSRRTSPATSPATADLEITRAPERHLLGSNVTLEPNHIDRGDRLPRSHPVAIPLSTVGGVATTDGIRYVAYRKRIHYDGRCDADVGRGWRRRVESGKGERWWFNRGAARRARKAPKARSPRASRGRPGTSAPPTGSTGCSGKKFDQRPGAGGGASPSSSAGHSSGRWTRVTDPPKPDLSGGSGPPATATSPSDRSDDVELLRCTGKH